MKGMEHQFNFYYRDLNLNFKFKYNFYNLIGWNSLGGALIERNGAPGRLR